MPQKVIPLRRYLLPSLCPFLGGSTGGKETKVFSDPLLGGTGDAARRDIEGLPADVERTDGVSSPMFQAN